MVCNICFGLISYKLPQHFLILVIFFFYSVAQILSWFEAANIAVVSKLRFSILFVTFKLLNHSRFQSRIPLKIIDGIPDLFCQKLLLYKLSFLCALNVVVGISTGVVNEAEICCLLLCVFIYETGFAADVWWIVHSDGTCIISPSISCWKCRLVSKSRCWFLSTFVFIRCIRSNCCILHMFLPVWMIRTFSVICDWYI